MRSQTKNKYNSMPQKVMPVTMSEDNADVVNVVKRDKAKRASEKRKKRIKKKLAIDFRDAVVNWDKKIMSYVMFVVVSLTVFTATVAWFTVSKSVGVSGMFLKTATSNGIQVEILVDGVKTELFDESVDVFADLEMKDFTNVEEDEVAPGVYGQITLYITTLNEYVNSYEIIPSICLESRDDEYNPGITEEIELLAQGHILFFEEKEVINGVVTGGSGQQVQTVYSDFSKFVDKTAKENVAANEVSYIYEPVAPGEIFKGSLEWDSVNLCGVEKEVVIYWYWPYEYVDLVNSGLLIEEEEQAVRAENTLWNKEVFAQDKVNELTIDGKRKYTDTQLYDYADTKIGTIVENLNFRLQINGINTTE